MNRCRHCKRSNNLFRLRCYKCGRKIHKFSGLSWVAVSITVLSILLLTVLSFFVPATVNYKTDIKPVETPAIIKDPLN